MSESAKVLDLAAKTLRSDEGFKQHLYTLNGIQHIGYGFNLESIGILPEEAEYILYNRIRIASEELSRVTLCYPTLSDNRRAILINLCYNMGVHILVSFRKFFDAIHSSDWELAAKELLNSEAAIQNPARMERLAYCFEADIL